MEKFDSSAKVYQFSNLDERHLRDFERYSLVWNVFMQDLDIAIRNVEDELADTQVQDLNSMLIAKGRLGALKHVRGFINGIIAEIEIQSNQEGGS